MLNDLSIYTYVGVKAAEARNVGDEAKAKFESDWAKRAISMEAPTDRLACRQAFDEAYKRARNVPRL